MATIRPGGIMFIALTFAASACSGSAGLAPAGSSRQTSAERPALRLLRPSAGRIIRRFGPDSDGLEFAGRPGDPVRAAASGTVAFVGQDDVAREPRGYTLMLRHPGGLMTVYRRLERPALSLGQMVAAGDAVGRLAPGAAGRRAALAFEVRRSRPGRLAVATDPLPLLEPQTPR